jgi:uncharacterized protein
MDTPHLPYPAPIEAYGKGGFRFAGMSHRGSLLCLPSGILAWPVTAPSEIADANLAPVWAVAAQLDLFLIGTGRDMALLAPSLRELFRDAGLKVEPMQTGPAISTYNLLLGEGRRVGAGLIAVE